MKEQAKAKAKGAPAAAPGAGWAKSNRVKGGFLDDKTAEIVDAICVVKTFTAPDFKTGEEKEITGASLHITYDVEGVPGAVERDYSLGGTTVPYDDGEPATEGVFIGGADPAKAWRGLHETCAASIYLDHLEKLGGYDEATLINEGVREALVGVKGVLNEHQPPAGKPKKGEKARERRGFPVFTSIETAGGGIEAKAGAAPVKAASKPNGKIAEPVEEEVEEDGDSLETRVSELVVKLAAKGPITKARLSQAVGKAFDTDDDRAEKVKAVSLAIKDSFLKAMAAEGEIAYDGREIGPAA